MEIEARLDAPVRAVNSSHGWNETRASIQCLGQAAKRRRFAVHFVQVGPMFPVSKFLVR